MTDLMAKNNAIRQIVRKEYPSDFLTVFDLLDYNIGKAILVNGTWYKIIRQKKKMGARSSVAQSMFQLKPAVEYHQDDPEAIEMANMAPLPNNGWITFKQIVDNVNNGRWGFQLKDMDRGKNGWFGMESPRHEGRHDGDNNG